MHERIKQYLIDHGISQTFVARKIGKNFASFNLIMNGKRKLNADELIAICDVLGVSVDLFREKETA